MGEVADCREPDWLIWTPAIIYPVIPRATLVFEVHNDPAQWSLGTHSAYRDTKLILLTPNEQFPRACILPADELMGQFGSIFSSSIAWMVAYAITRKPSLIKLAGISLSHPAETGQRDAIWFLLGMAKSKGYDVDLGTSLTRN